MKLTITERWILSNQYSILAKLDPEQSDYYDRIREAIDSGYELHFSPDNLTTDPDEIMTELECREVLDILSMFRVLRQSLDRLADQSDVPKRLISFDGFDGNNETKQMAYVQYFCERLKRFEGEVDLHDLNSHSERLPRYRAMLAAYTRIKETKNRDHSMDGYLFTKDELLAVANAR